MKYKHKATGLTVESVKSSPKEEIFFFAKGYNYQYQIPASIVESGDDWEEIVEEPLLTTEDKVEIFDKQQELYAVNINNWLASTTKIGGWADSTGGREYGWRFFSTKEKRLEYMANGRSLFTVEEVVSLRYHTQGEILDRAKKKLKANDSNL